MPRTSGELSDALLRLVLASGIGPALFERLLARFGSAEAICEAPIVALRDIEGIGAKTAQSIRAQLDEAEIDDERAAMDEHDVALIVRGDADSPPLLSMIPDAPVALRVRGSITDDDALAVAIVGSRRCTAYGRDQAARLGTLLAQSGLTIVSGGARGIDGEAHRAALRARGRTIVVTGCGLAHCYPPEHAELFDRIVKEERGAIVSEFPMRISPRAEHFPRRNRIISGLSLGVLVIEAGKGSGALITARQAAEEHGREVMALPGRVDSPASQGCNALLRDGGASMVLNHADVLQQLESAKHLLRGAFEAAGEVLRVDDDDDAAIEEGSRSPVADEDISLFAGHLTDHQSAILEALQEALREKTGALLPDEIAAATQIGMSELMADLTLLQIRGVIARDASGFRVRQVRPE